MTIKPTNRSKHHPEKLLEDGLNSHSNPNEVQVPPAEHGTRSDTFRSKATFEQGNPNTQKVLKEKKSFGELVDEAYKGLEVDLKPEAGRTHDISETLAG